MRIVGVEVVFGAVKLVQVGIRLLEVGLILLMHWAVKGMRGLRRALGVAPTQVNHDVAILRVVLNLLATIILFHQSAESICDAWFFEAQALGGACPRPVDLGVSRRLNRRRNRGGLSFGSAGWARSAARGCRAAVRRRFTQLERAARHASGHNWTDYNASGMGAHICPSCGEKTRHGRHIMSEYGSYVTNVRV